MKQILLTGLIVGSAALSAGAQGSYQDDVYSSAPVAPSSTQARSDGYRSDRYDDGYDDRGSYRSGSYAGDYDYIDYEDDYTYSTRFRRFNDPFYNVGYWSGFWMPWSYDPFWGSPWYGGYSGYGWGRPGVYVSVGFGGPYWSSGWGWSNWYGYSPFHSYWGRPWYASGWGGGWGYGSGYNWGYRNGYWDGYYDGLYGAGVGSGYGYGRRTVNYAPRATVGGVNGVGFRNTNPEYRSVSSLNRSSRIGAGDRSIGTAPDRNIGTRGGGTSPIRTMPDRTQPIERSNVPQRNGIDRTTRPLESTPPVRDNRAFDRNTTPIRESSPVRQGQMPDRTFSSPDNGGTRPRGGFFGNSDRATPSQSVEPIRQMPQRDRDFSQPRQMESPRFERTQPSFDRPQMSAPQRNFDRPQMSAPQRNFDRPQMSAPQRSFDRPQMSAPQRSFERPQMSAPSAPRGGGFSSPSGGGFRGGGMSPRR